MGSRIKLGVRSVEHSRYADSMLVISSWILQNNVAANNARKASCVSKVFQMMLLGYGKEGGGEVYRYDSEGERRLSR